jgi:hypothetical protein
VEESTLKKKMKSGRGQGKSTERARATLAGLKGKEERLTPEKNPRWKTAD